MEQFTDLKETCNQSALQATESSNSGVQSFESGRPFSESKLQDVDSGVQPIDNSAVSSKLPTKTVDTPQKNLSIKENISAGSSSKSMARAGDPRFLNEFYSNSRLHFLSTWKAEFKNYVNELQSKGDNFMGRELLRKLVNTREVTRESEMLKGGKPERCVMHVDMDCFFVSVGLRRRPDLKGNVLSVSYVFFLQVNGKYVLHSPVISAT